MIIGILKEPSFESRVSLLAGEAAALTKSGHAVWVEKGAGLKAFCIDEDYRASGSEIRSRSEILAGADMLLSIHADDCLLAATNKTIIGVYQPLYHLEEIDSWLEHRNTVFSLDLLPRTTRAQSMDILSSQASIARGCGAGSHTRCVGRAPQMLIERARSQLLLVDMQERLVPAMTGAAELIANCG
ncbi:MAG: hypothetical protein ACXVI9_09695, partial [Mucilaginibacter sp.]